MIILGEIYQSKVWDIVCQDLTKQCISIKTEKPILEKKTNIISDEDLWPHHVETSV